MKNRLFMKVQLFLYILDADVSRYLQISKSTVRYWLARYETTGDVEAVNIMKHQHLGYIGIAVPS